jgi:anti-sigma regulatory factor (Ser/Thr protein kinase)
LYERPSDFVTTTVGFIQDGLAAGERVLVVAEPEKWGWLRQELGPDARSVAFVDTAVAYQPQAKATRIVLDFLMDRSLGPVGSRVVAEHPTGALTEAEARDFMRQEAAANLVYAPYRVSILCPYDIAHTDPPVLALCRRTHPELLDGAGATPNPDYTDPRAFVREWTAALPVPADAASLAVEAPGDLALARQFARAQARLAGLSGPRVDEVALAVNELVSNSLLYGAAPRRLSVFVRHQFLVFDVSDAGQGPDPLSACLPPRMDRPGGRGLWIAHLTSDALEFGRAPDGAHVQAIAVLFR